MKKRFITFTLAAVMSVSLLAGCGKTEEATTAAATEAVTEATTEATTEAVTEAATEATTEAATSSDASNSDKPTQDRSGNDIVIPDEVNRIISMAPSTTRFLIDLGLADKIVAIDTNSYAYIEQLPTDVQQFDMMSPDNEALVALEPDIIFTSNITVQTTPAAIDP